MKIGEVHLQMIEEKVWPPSSYDSKLHKVYDEVEVAILKVDPQCFNNGVAYVLSFKIFKNQNLFHFWVVKFSNNKISFKHKS